MGWVMAIVPHWSSTAEDWTVIAYGFWIFFGMAICMAWRASDEETPTGFETRWMLGHNALIVFGRLCRSRMASERLQPTSKEGYLSPIQGSLRTTSCELVQGRGQEVGEGPIHTDVAPDSVVKDGIVVHGLGHGRKVRSDVLCVRMCSGTGYNSMVSLSLSGPGTYRWCVEGLDGVGGRSGSFRQKRRRRYRRSQCLVGMRARGVIADVQNDGTPGR